MPPAPSISSLFPIAGPPSRRRHAGKAANLQYSPQGLYALVAQLGERPEDMGVRRFESGRGQLKQLPCEASPQSGVRRITWG